MQCTNPAPLRNGLQFAVGLESKYTQNQQGSGVLMCFFEHFYLISWLKTYLKTSFGQSLALQIHKVANVIQ